MAKAAREFVTLECTSCGSRNYRTQRGMGHPQGKKSGSPASMDNNRLVLKKYCRMERKHTIHRESRKK